MNRSLLSWLYIAVITDHCRRFDKQAVAWALVLALDKAGNSRLAKIAMIAMTTSSSIKVKAAGGEQRRVTGLTHRTLKQDRPDRIASRISTNRGLRIITGCQKHLRFVME